MGTDAPMSTTRELVDLVARSLGHPEFNPASDRKIGRALGISHTHVARLRSGDDVMTLRTFAQAAKLLDLAPADISGYSLRLLTDAAADESVKDYFRARAAEFSEYMKSIAGKAASVAGGVILSAMMAHSPSAEAGTYARHAVELARSVYTLCELAAGKIARATSTMLRRTLQALSVSPAAPCLA